MKNIKLLILTLLFTISVCAFSQSALPAESGNFLATTNGPGNGDNDPYMVVFFEVPETVTGDIYFAVKDPGVDNSQTDADPETGTAGYWSYSLIGGTGAITGANAKLDIVDATSAYTGSELSLIDGNAGGNAFLDSETTGLQVDTGATYDESWVYFNPVNVTQGEKIGNKYYFKVTAYYASTDKNAFRLDASYNNIGTPTGVTSIKSFAYAWTLSLLERAGTPWDLYPFVPDGATGDIEIKLHDFDNAESCSLYDISGGTATTTNATTNPGFTGNAYPSLHTFSIGAETNGTWNLNIQETVGGPADGINTSQVYVTLDGSTTEFQRIYASPYEPTPPDHVIITLEDGLSKIGAIGEMVSLQLVDSAGDPATYIRNVYVSLTGSDLIGGPDDVPTIYTDSVTPGTYDQDMGSATLITTDSDGMATFMITDAEAEIATIVLTTDGTSGSTNLVNFLPNESDTIVFSAFTAPTISSITNSTLDISTTTGISDVTILENEAGNITTGNDIRIKIPTELIGTYFNSGATVGTAVINGTQGAVSTISYEGGAGTYNVLLIDVITADFDDGRLLTIDGIELISSTVEASGKLLVSVDGGTTYSLLDDKVITIVDPSTNIWYGSVDTDWDTIGNWSLGSVPVAAQNIIIPSTTNNPILATDTPNLKSLEIRTGAILDTAGNSLNVVYTTSGTGKVSGGGSIVSSGGNLTLYELDSLGILDISGGNLFLGFDSTVDNLVFSNISLSPTQNLTVGSAEFDTVTLNVQPAKEFLITGSLTLTGGDSTVNADNALLSINSTVGSIFEVNLNNGSDIDITGNGSSSIITTLNGSTGSNLDIGIANFNVGTINSIDLINSSGGDLTISTSGNVNIAGSYGLIDVASPILSLSGDVSIAGDFTFEAFTNNGYEVSFTGTTTLTSTSTPVFDDVLILGSLTLASPITLEADWNQSGTFIHGSQVVTIDNDRIITNISGESTFFSLICVQQDKTIIFEAGKTQTIFSNLQLQSNNGTKQITLKSSLAGNSWGLDTGASTVTTRNLFITDSTSTIALSADTVGGSQSVDGGNNINWTGFTTMNNWTGAVDSEWSTVGNWSTNVVPIAGASVNDKVRIPSGLVNYPILTGNEAAYSVFINEGAILDLAGNDLAIEAAGTLINQGTIRLSLGSTINMIDERAGTVEFYGVGAISTLMWGNNKFYNIIMSGSGVLSSHVNNLDIRGSLDIQSGSFDIPDTFNLKIAGDISSYSPTAITTTTNSEIQFNADLTIQDNMEFQNINILTGVLTLNSPISISGNFVNSSDFESNGNKVTLNGTTDISVNVTAFDDLEISAGSTLILSTGIEVGGDWITSPTSVFTPGANYVEFIDGTKSSTIYGDNSFDFLTCITPGKSLIFESAKTQTIGTLTLNGSESGFITLSPSSFDKFILDSTTSVVDYISVSNSTISQDIDAGYHSVNGGGNELVGPPKWTFHRDIYEWTGGTNTNWNLLTNWEMTSDRLNPTVPPTSSDWVMIPGGLTNYPNITSGNIEVKNLNISSGATVEISGTTVLNPDNFNNEGTLKISDSALTIVNDIDSGTVEYSDSSDMDIRDFGTTDYFNLKLSGSGTKTILSGLTVAGEINISDGILDSNGNDINIYGDWSQGSGASFTTGTNKVYFQGNSTIQNDVTFYNIEVSNGATLSLAGDIIVYSIDLLGTVNGGTSTLAVKKDWNNTSGTFNRDTGIVEFLDDAEISVISGNTVFNILRSIDTANTPDKILEFTTGTTQSFYDLDIDGDAIGTRIVLRGTANADWNFKNLKGSVAQVSYVSIFYGQVDDLGSDINASDSIFDANTDETLSGTPIGSVHWIDVTPVILTWEGDDGGDSTNWDVAANWDNNQVPTIIDTVIITTAGTPPVLTSNSITNNLTILAGATLDTSTFDLEIDGSLDIQATGTLVRSGVASQNISKTDIDSGTVEYGGTTTIQDYSGVDYFNLVINGVTVTAADNLDIAGDLTLTAGIFTHGSKTISFSGGLDSTITGAFTFYDLDINKDTSIDQVNLSSDIVIDNDLFLNQGILDFGTTSNSIKNDLNLNSGSLSAGSGILTLSGSFNNNGGTFTAQTGEVSIDDISKTTVITGSNTFNVLSSVTDDKTIRFTAGATQTITTLTITGSTNKIDLFSTIPGSSWNMSVTSASINNMNLQDSFLLGGNDITVSDTDCNDISNNKTTGTNPLWVFVSTFTWTGGGAAGLWSDIANWDTGVVPNNATYDVLIPTTPAGNATNWPELLASGLTLDELTIETGAILDFNGADLALTTLNLNAGGEIRLNGDETYTATTTTLAGSVVYYGFANAGVTIATSLPLGYTYYDLEFQDTTGFNDIWELGNNLVLNAGGTLTITSGVLDLKGFNLTSPTVIQSANGGIMLEGSETYTVTTSTLSGTTTYYGTVGVNILTGLNLGNAYTNLTFTGDDTFRLGADLAITGDMVITTAELESLDFSISITGDLTGTGTLDTVAMVTGTKSLNIDGDISLSSLINPAFSAGGFTVAGDWNVTNYTYTGETLTLDGTTTPTSITSNGQSLGNILISKSANTDIVNILDPIVNAGNVTITAGNLNTGDNSTAISGYLTGAGIFDSSSITGANKLNIDSYVTIDNFVSTNTGVAVDGFTVAGNWDVANYTSTGGTLEFDGGTDTTITSNGQALANIQIAKDLIGDTVTLLDTLVSAGNVTIVQGTFITGDFSTAITGILSGAGIFNSSAMTTGQQLNIDGNVTVDNFVSTNTGVTADGFTVAGNWDVANYTSTGGTLEFDGAANTTIMSNGQGLGNIQISKDLNVDTVTLLDPLVNVGNLTIPVGTFITDNFSTAITGNLTGAGIFDSSGITGANILNIDGNVTVTNFTSPNTGVSITGFTVAGDFNVTTYTSTGGTLTFDGAADTIFTTNAHTYGVININKDTTADILTLTGVLTSGAITLTQGVLNADTNNADITAAGFEVPSEANAQFIGTNQTITLTGGNLKSIELFNLLVTGAVTITGDSTTAGSFSQTGGTLTTGVFNLILGGASNTLTGGTITIPTTGTIDSGVNDFTVSTLGSLILSGGSLTGADLFISNTSGTASILSSTAASTISAANIDYTGAFGTIDIDDISFDISSSWDDSAFSGTWTAPTTSGDITFTTDPGTLTSKALHDLYNIIVDDGVTLTMLASTGITVNNVTVGPTATATLITGDNLLTIGGNLTGTGVFNSSAITGVNKLNIDGNVTVNDFTSPNTGVAIDGFTVAGDLNVTNYTSTGGTLTFDGAVDITFTTNAHIYGVININKDTTADILTLTGDLTSGAITLTQGVFNADTNNANITAAGFEVPVEANAQFIGTNQTITLTGGNLKSIELFNLLVTGAITMTGDSTTTGSFSLTGGSLTTGVFALTLGGVSNTLTGGIITLPTTGSINSGVNDLTISTLGRLILSGGSLTCADLFISNTSGAASILSSTVASTISAANIDFTGAFGTIDIDDISFDISNSWDDSGFSGAWIAPTTSGTMTYTTISGTLTSATGHTLFDIDVDDGVTLTLQPSTGIVVNNVTIGTALTTAELDTVNVDISIAGDLTGTGTLTSGINTVTVAGDWGIATHTPHGTATNGIIDLTGTSAINSAGTQTFNTLNISGAITLSAAIIILNDINISGNLTDGTQDITVARNWNNTGTFTASTGTVFLNSTTTANITGSNTFNALTSTTGSKTITFEAGSTQTVATLTINGSAGNLITLESSIPGTKWNIDNTGTNSVTFISVSDSDITGTVNINAGNNSLNSGNNDITGAAGYWIFTVTTITWDGSTDSNWEDASNWTPQSVPTFSNNVVIGDVTTDPVLTTDAFVNNLTLNNVNSALTIAGNVLTINNTLDNLGTFIRTGAGGESITKTDINSGIVRYITGAGAIEDYGGGTDYYNLEVLSGTKTLGTATIIANDLTVDGTLTQNATIDVINNVTINGTGTINQNADLTIGEDIVIDGILTPGAVTVNLTSATADITGTGTATFGTLNVTGTTTLGDNITVNTDLTGTGILIAANNTINLGGSWTIQNFTHDTSTVIFNSTQTITTGADFEFYNLSSTGGTTLTVDENLTVQGNLSINNILALDADNLELYGNNLLTGTVTGTTGNINVHQTPLTSSFIDFNNATTADLFFTGNVVLSNNFTTSTAGNITFSGTVTGASNLSVSSSAGNITFTNNLNINNLTVPTVSGDILFSGNIVSQDLTLLSTTGDITFNGSVDTDDLDVTASGVGKTVTFAGVLTNIGINSAASVPLSIDADNIIFQANVGIETTTALATITGAVDIQGITITSGSDLTFTEDITLSSSAVSIDTSGSNRDLTFGSTINGGFAFVVNAGTGYVDFNGIIGGTTALTSVTVDSSRADLSGVTGITGNFDINTPVANGIILLEGALYNVTGIVTLDAGDQTTTGGLFIDNSTLAKTFTTGNMTTVGTTYIYGIENLTFTNSALTFNDVHLFLDGDTISINNDITLDNLVLYGGIIDLNGNNLTVNMDMVLLGAGYNIDDGTTGVVGAFAYNHADRVATINTGLLTDFISGYNPGFVFPGAYSGAYTNLDSSVISVTNNFYNNGTDMSATANWNLNIPNNDNATTAFAEAYNMNVQWGTANFNIASLISVIPDVNSSNWEITEPDFDLTATGLKTMYDDVILINLVSGAFENSNNEISAALATGLIGVFDNAINTGDLASYTDPECTITTDGAGDIALFYLRVENSPTYRWNTDATGLSAGTGTDRGRSGVAAVTRTTIPNLVASSNSLTVFYTLIDTNKNRVKHYPIGSKITGILDGAKPAITQILASTHATGTADTFDGHNYFDITFSEDVSYDVSGGPFSTFPVVNSRSSGYAFGTYGGDLGYIEENGANVDVVGLFSYPGNYSSGSFDGTANSNTIYSTAANQLRINVVAYQNTGIWPGYLGSIATNIDTYNKITSPSALFHRNNFNLEQVDLLAEQTDAELITQLTDGSTRVITVPGNADITDSAGNSLESSTPNYDAYYKTPGFIGGTGWDVFPPYFSKQVLENGDITEVYEIYYLDYNLIVGNRIVDEINFHVLDDHIMQPFWISWTGWDKGTPTTATRPDPIGGLRENTFMGNSGAYAMGVIGDASRISTPILGMNTAVDTYMLKTPAPVSTLINSPDDNYFSLQIDESQNWLLKSLMNLTYDSSVGRATDYAGNLMPSSNNSLDAFQWIPPEILLSLSIVDDRTVYLQYTKDIYTNSPTIPIRTGITKDSYSLAYSEGNSIENVLAIKGTATDTVGKSEFLLTFANPITANDMVTARLVTNTLTIFDKYGTETGPDERRLTDLGLGLVTPAYGNDSLHYDGRLRNEDGSLKDFDGTGRLIPEDIVIGTEINGSNNQSLGLTLLYDIDTDLSAAIDYDTTDSVYNPGLWLPDNMVGTYIYTTLNLRELSTSGSDGDYKLFSVDNLDNELEVGGTFQFIYKLAAAEDLYCVALPEGGSYLTDLVPWEFDLDSLKTQRGGVTIVNNVINPLDDQKTEIYVEQDKPGMSTISVFSLDGTVITNLQKGRLSAGTYRYQWDGKNNSGKAVARGIYFIKVIAPDINESRKVLIVK
ncbi:MAG: hypothetical protein OCD02_04160 [Spirochaetaceae bacterium]